MDEIAPVFKLAVYLCGFTLWAGIAHARAKGDGERSLALHATPAQLSTVLRSAGEGATVILESGELAEAVAVDRPLTLRGDGHTEVLLRGIGQLQIRSKGVNLRGFTLSGGTVAIEVAPAAEANLSSMEFQGQSQAAIHAANASLNIERSSFESLGRTASGVDASGGSASIVNSRFVRAGAHAVHLMRGRGVLKALQLVHGSGTCLHFADHSVVELHDIDLQAQGGTPIYVANSRLRAVAARVKGGEFGIMGFDGSSVTLQQVTVTDTSYVAIAFLGSAGQIEASEIERGGSAGGIAVHGAREPVLISNVQLRMPGRVGIDVMQSPRVTIEKSSVSGARTDREGDLGDGIYAVSSGLRLNALILENNQGSGLALTDSSAQVDNTDLRLNEEAGMLLEHRSTGTLRGSRLERNGAGILVLNGGQVTSVGNRFFSNRHFALDETCGGGVITLRGANTFLGRNPIRRHCPFR